MIPQSFGVVKCPLLIFACFFDFCKSGLKFSKNEFTIVKKSHDRNRAKRRDFMRKRILEYYARIQKLLKDDAPDTDWDAVLEEHLVQVQFFQHERLIHLIVTVLFAILLFLSMLMLYMDFQLPPLLLGGLLLVLLVPYIRHYYLLENTVQKMYEQYDQLRKKSST